MSTPSQPAENPDEPAVTPQADLRDGLFWLSLGAVIAILSWRMDRLQDQHINPYTAPGLVPGIIGLAMLLLGALLVVVLDAAFESFDRPLRRRGANRPGA